MKNLLLIFILISNILFIECDLELDDNQEEYPDNINIESISYELTYNNYSVVKVVIKSYDQLDVDISFIAYLKSQEEKKEYILNCYNTFYDLIECFSQRNVIFNLNDKFYFYYNKTNSKLKLGENDVLEDDKQISLVFKPELEIDEKLFRDNRRFIAAIDSKMVGGGYLYITKEGKSPLNMPKDDFNEYIDLNNFIPCIGLHHEIPLSTLTGYKMAIQRGYHIVDAVLRFTSDKKPVISHEEDLEKISNGKGKISSKKYKELLKLDFGSIIDQKYKGEKILGFEILLQLCKDLNVIIDLDISHLDYKTYFQKDFTYADIILDTIEKYEMLDSVYFSDGPSYQNVLKLMEDDKTISVAIPNLNDKESFDKIKKQFNTSKRLIYSSGEISYGNTLIEDNVKYIKSIGDKTKAGIVDNLDYAHKIQSWGINLISTKSLPSFLIKNEKEEPIIVRCEPLDEGHSECEIEDDIILNDNQWYNIYYSNNIYNISQDIDDKPIGKFQYIDTNLLDELYYKINELDFAQGFINLTLSQPLKIEEEIIGIVGPAYDSVAECYQYNFICRGNNNYTVICLVEKDDKSKVEFSGNYSIYDLEDYSLNPVETDERIASSKETYMEYIVDKKLPYFLICCIIILLLIIGIIIYFVKFRKTMDDQYDRIRIADNNYISDNYLYR